MELEEEVVREFYAGIGDPHPPSGRLEDGVRTIDGLLQDGHTLDQINITIRRVLANHKKTPVYSFGVIPHAIGQAVQDEVLAKEAKAKRKQQQQQIHRIREEEERLFDEKVAAYALGSMSPRGADVAAQFQRNLSGSLTTREVA